MEPPEEPVSGEKLDVAAPGPRVATGSPSTAKPAPARASPRTRAKAPPAKKAPKAAKKAAPIPPKASDTVGAAGEKEQERPLVDGAAASSAPQPLQPLTEAGETPSPSCPPDGAREEVSQPQLPVVEPAQPSSLPPASTPLPPESPSKEPAAKRAKPATPKAAVPPAAAGLCPKKAPKAVKKAAQIPPKTSPLPPASTPLPPESPSEEPAAKRAKPATPEAAVPPATAGLCPKKAPKATKKAAQIPPKASDTVDAAGEKEQERPLVDVAAASSAPQPLQPLTRAGETPSPSCPPDGAREEVSQPQLPVTEPAQPSSLPPASTPLQPESCSEEPAAKSAKPATPEAAVPPAAAGLCQKKGQEPGMQKKQPVASAASNNALRQGQATAADAPTLPSHASSMDILKSLSVVEGPKDLPLSGDKGGTRDPHSCRGLFSPLLFKTLLQKAKATAGIEADPAASDPALSHPNILLFSERPHIKEEIPCPKFFLDVVQRQWEKPSGFTNPGINERRYYNVDQDLMDTLKTPTVDGPVAALVSSTALPSLMVDHLTPEEKRMETLLRKVNTSAAWAVRSAVAASFFNRTSLLWLKEMQARIPATDCQTHEDINHLIAAAEFSADATLNSAMYASRAIGSSVSARRLLWLRYWQTDNRSKWKLACSPFKGDKLFGEALEPLLIETKDKKKVLPATFKKPNKQSSSKVQKPSFRGGENTQNSSQPHKAYFQRPDRQSDRAGYRDRSRQQFQSEQPFRGSGSRPFHGSSRGLHRQPSQIQPSRGQAATGDCSPKGFEEVKSDSRVKNTQQASGIQEIQHPVHTGQNSGGRIPDVNRSYRSMPTRSYIVDSPTISMDKLRDMPVQRPNENTSYALGSPQDYPHSRPTLSGQPVDRILSPPGHRGPPHHDPGPSGSFRESGIHSQPRQEPLVSYQKDAPPSSIYRHDIMHSLPVPGLPAQHQRSGEADLIGSNSASRPRLTIVRKDGVLRLHLSRPTSAVQGPEGTRPVVIRGLTNQLQLARAQTMPRNTPMDPDHHLRIPYSDPSRQQSHQGPYEPPWKQPLQDIDYRTQDPIGSPPVVDVTQYNQGKHIEETEPSRHRSGSRFSRLESPDRDPDGRRTVDRRGTTQGRQPDTDYRRTNPIQSPPVADVTDRNQGKHARETEPSRYRSGGRFSRLESPDRDRDGRRSADRRGTTRERQSARDRSRSRSPRRDRDRRSPRSDSSRKRRH